MDFRREGTDGHILTLRMLEQKHQEKKLSLVYLDLEMAYDTIKSRTLWQVFEIYGVEGTLIKAMQSAGICKGEGHHK